MNNFLNKNLIVAAVVVVGVLVAGAIFYTYQGGKLSSEKAAELAMAFINENIEEGFVASLIDITEEDNVYKLNLEIGDTDYESFITKDGKFLFPTGISLEDFTSEEAGETAETVSYSSLDAFAQCLTEKEMKFYGTATCPWCTKEKELFGESLQYLAYVECLDAETGQWSQICQAEGISSVPTWQLPSGELESGYKTLEDLSGVSGCPLE